MESSANGGSRRIVRGGVTTARAGAPPGMPTHASSYQGPYMFGEDGFAGRSNIAGDEAQGSFGLESQGSYSGGASAGGTSGFGGVDYGPLRADPGAMASAYEFMRGMWD